MTGGGNLRTGQGIHQTGFPRAGSSQQTNHQKALGNAIKPLVEFQRLIKQSLLFFTSQEEEGFLMQQTLDAMEITL
jgi:hypothetical protein